jgi:hypothetical protein
MKPVVSRGDDALKIDSWPQAMVICVGLLATAGVVGFLVSAGWSSEAIIAFATLAVGLFAGQLVQARKGATVEAKTDQQTATLAQLVDQTNGKSEAELDEIADRAVLKLVAAYKRGDLK